MDLCAAFEMKIQDSKFHNNEKPFPGCLGRMVNLFDLTAGVTGNRLLTDKPHRDGNLICIISLFTQSSLTFHCCGKLSDLFSFPSLVIFFRTILVRLSSWWFKITLWCSFFADFNIEVSGMVVSRIED